MANIVISGASRGIGYETTKQLLAGGHRVVAISRHTQKLQRLQQKVGDKLILVSLDLENFEPSALHKQLPPAVDCLDGLINNAGYLKHGSFEALPLEEAQKMFTVNLFGAALLLKALLPLLKKSEMAHVVNISSMGGFQGSAKFAGLSWYSASKAALASLTEVLAEEYKAENLRFNSLALGAVQTEMLAEAFPGYQAPMQANEMASYLADFVLNGHRFFNGKTLPVSLSTP